MAEFMNKPMGRRAFVGGALATGVLGAIYPAQADQITALASASQTIAGIDGVYLAMFVALPLAQWLYRTLEPRFAALRHEPSDVLADMEKEKAAKAENAKEEER